MRIKIQRHRLILIWRRTAPGSLTATTSDIAALVVQRSNVHRQIGMVHEEGNAIMAQAQAEANARIVEAQRHVQTLDAQLSALHDEDAKLQGELRMLEKLRARP